MQIWPVKPFSTTLMSLGIIFCMPSWSCPIPFIYWLLQPWHCQTDESLKGIAAIWANLILGLTGRPFWQEESYDHLVRHEHEFETIRIYVEENPVRAALVRDAKEYPWSSAGWATGGACGRGGPPYRK